MSVLCEVNDWCRENGIREFTEDNLGSPDSKGPKIVKFLRDKSFANRGFAGYLFFEYENGNNRYERAIKVNSWKKGLSPALIDSVLGVVLAKIADKYFFLVAENYRINVSSVDLECARGFATDVDWRNEAKNYSDVLLPEIILKPGKPDDGILGLEAAKKEIREEIAGQTRLHKVWYTGFIHEANSIATMHTSMWLATVEVDSMDSIKAEDPDPEQGSLRFIPVEALSDQITNSICGAQVISAFSRAQTVMQRVKEIYGNLTPLWNGFK